MKRGIFLGLILILFITGCGNKISQQDLEKIDISMYTPRPATIMSYDFINEDGGLLNNFEWIITYSESQQQLLFRENSSSVYVEGHRVNKEEFVLTSITSILGHSVQEQIILTNKLKQWRYDERDEERVVCEITRLNTTVDTSYGRFEDCIEVTNTVEGKTHSKTYYAPYAGNVAIDNADGIRIVDLTNIKTLKNFEEMNSIYNMHISGEDYYEYNGGDLNSAVIEGDLKAVQSLINSGVDINNKNEFGITMLMEASRLGYKDIVKFLLENGADPNQRAVNSETALLWAVDEEYIDIIQLLINVGANTNIKGEFDRTPLWVACKLGNIQIARMLLENGADPNLKIDNEDGSTPLSIAKDKGLTELVKLLGTY